MPGGRLGIERHGKTHRRSMELSGIVSPQENHSWQLCVDYRKLNAVTRTDESLDAISGRIFFSTLDLVSGY